MGKEERRTRKEHVILWSFINHILDDVEDVLRLNKELVSKNLKDKTCMDMDGIIQKYENLAKDYGIVVK